MKNEPNKKTDPKKPTNQDTSITNKPDEKVASAQEQADKDIEDDPDLSMHSPNDDLDEGELARLGDDDPGVL